MCLKLVGGNSSRSRTSVLKVLPQTSQLSIEIAKLRGSFRIFPLKCRRVSTKPSQIILKSNDCRAGQVKETKRVTKLCADASIGNSLWIL
jgi:hypothetical protein